MNRTKRARRPLSGTEIARAVADLNEEFVVDTFGRPPAGAAAQWARARRKRGRPKKGRGAKVISVTIERTLLARSDALSRKMAITRAELIARGLKAVLAAEGIA